MRLAKREDTTNERFESQEICVRGLMHDLGLGIGYAIGHGKYVLTDRLGEGGMAEVWGAINQRTMLPVALKFQRANAHTDPRERIRFFREAKHTIEHEHVVRIYDVDQLNEHVPFLVMERLSGKTLRHQLRACGALALAQTANVMMQVVSAIANVHSAHIIHRDLKPGNIMLLERVEGDDFSKVIDFGIAKSLRRSVHDPPDGQLTRTDAVVGTPGYMAPEQAMGMKEIGFAADVWALGVILYECLSGRRLWANPDDDAFKVAAYMNASRTVDAALSSLGDGIPPSMRDVISGALRVESAERISLAAMLDVLAEYAVVRVPPISFPKNGTKYEEKADDETKTHSAVHSDVSPRQRKCTIDVPTMDSESPEVVPKDDAVDHRPRASIWLEQEKPLGVLGRRTAFSYAVAASACLGVGGFGIVMARDVIPPDELDLQSASSVNESSAPRFGDDFQKRVVIEEGFTAPAHPNTPELHSLEKSSQTRFLQGKSSKPEGLSSHHQKANTSMTSTIKPAVKLSLDGAAVGEVQDGPNLFGTPLRDSPLAAAIQTRKVP